MSLVEEIQNLFGRDHAVHLNAGTNLGLAANPWTVTDAHGKEITHPQKEWPSDPEKVPLPFLDTGVFITELTNKGFLPWRLDSSVAPDPKEIQKNPEVLAKAVHELRQQRVQEGKQWQVEEASWRETQLKLTKVYDLIEKRYTSYMDTANLEPTVPSALPLSKRKTFYHFAADQYPPHLNLAANTTVPGLGGDMQDPNLDQTKIFNKMRIAQLSSLLPTVMPKSFIGALKYAGLKVAQLEARAKFGGMGRPDEGTTIQHIEQYNVAERSRAASWFHQKDIFDKPNIGDLADWYTDARFAQQHFTGTNPTTIERVAENSQWAKHFLAAATEQKLDSMKTKITNRLAKKSLYMQDYSYFRKHAGVDADAIMKCVAEDLTTTRYGVAAVVIFDLEDGGKLHPLGIVPDWRGSAAKSVTIFNRNVERSDGVDEKTDWPWRYAKTCVQASDWLRHECTVHLCYTHMVEEATIVAANRSFELDHMVYQLLYPHWQKTLSLNAAARDTLVPSVIVPIVGMDDDNAYQFIRSAYEVYDFEGSYAPKDLERRGFPIADLDKPKYHNYAWARCIYSIWNKIHRYVEDMLKIQYGGAGKERDDLVKNDTQVKTWCDEMHSEHGAQLKTFPTITTFAGLVDCVTMCIHLASPQHSSVNYLQNYYQSFVINKPPCLYQTPPESLQELKKFKEADLVAALPMNHPQEWLLASHIPYLLSFKPGDKESLIMYAASKYHVHRNAKTPQEEAVKVAAARFYTALADSEDEFRQIASHTDDAKEIIYDVLSPSWNAVSIVI